MRKGKAIRELGHELDWRWPGTDYGTSKLACRNDGSGSVGGEGGHSTRCSCGKHSELAFKEMELGTMLTG